MATKEQIEAAIANAVRIVNSGNPFTARACKASDFCGNCDYGWINIVGTQNDGHGRQERHIYRERCECVK